MPDISKINNVAVADISKLDAVTFADGQKVNNQDVSLFTYNGITWTTDDVLPVGSNDLIMCGKVDTALYVNSGLASPLSYEHNGSSWASSVATGGAKHHAAQGGGTQDAAVIYGGYDGSSDGVTTDEYNGTSWSTVNSMTTGSAFATGGGEVQSSCFVTGGSQYGPDVDGVTVTQTYNGTTWTDESVASNGTGSGTAQNSGGGGLDACLAAAGHIWPGGITAVTNLFNKTAGTWTSKAAASRAVRYTASSSDGTRVYKIGGYGGGAYDGDHIYDTVESWVDNTWTTESVLPVKTAQAGWGGGGRQSPGGAFQAGGDYFNGSTIVSNSTQYYTAANTV